MLIFYSKNNHPWIGSNALAAMHCVHRTMVERLAGTAGMLRAVIGVRFEILVRTN